MSNSYFLLLKGIETSMAVDRIISKQLPHPYSNCGIDNENPEYLDSFLYKMFENSNIQYSQQLCIDLCLQTFFIDDCNCTSNSFFSFFNITNCQTESQSICSFNTYLETILKNENFINQNCIENGLCPLECNHTEFRISQSYSKFSIGNYVDYVLNHPGFKSKYDEKEMSLEDVENGIVKLNIYYDSLTYTESTESVSINFVSLFSSIGGFMGLFLGMSVMTLVEILEIIINILYETFLREKYKLHF
jgi:hypothetical protein